MEQQTEYIIQTIGGSNGNDWRCVDVAPTLESAREKMNEWQEWASNYTIAWRQFRIVKETHLSEVVETVDVKPMVLPGGGLIGENV